MPYVVKYCKVCNKPKRMYHTASVCAECRPSYMALKANEYIKQYQQNKRNTDETYRAKINAQSSASKYKVYHESPERQQYERNRRYVRRAACYRDWETDRKSTRLNSSHSAKSRMPSSA